jgi:hypothetical protein
VDLNSLLQYLASNPAIFEELLSIPPVPPIELGEHQGKNEFHYQSQRDYDGEKWENHCELCQNALDLQIWIHRDWLRAFSKSVEGKPQQQVAATQKDKSIIINETSSNIYIQYHLTVSINLITNPNKMERVLMILMKKEPGMLTLMKNLW